jgi:hypothetical protein
MKIMAGKYEICMHHKGESETTFNITFYPISIDVHRPPQFRNFVDEYPRSLLKKIQSCISPPERFTNEPHGSIRATYSAFGSQNHQAQNPSSPSQYSYDQMPY